MNQIEKNLWNHSNIGCDMDELPIYSDKEVIDDDLPESDLTERDLGHVTPPRMTLEVIDENEDKLDDSFYQIFWVIIRIFVRWHNSCGCLSVAHSIFRFRNSVVPCLFIYLALCKRR